VSRSNLCEPKTVEHMFPVWSLRELYHSLVDILLDSHTQEILILPHIFYLPLLSHFIFPLLNLLIHFRCAEDIIRVRIGEGVTVMILIVSDTWVCS